jgi:hypothetical protein
MKKIIIFLILVLLLIGCSHDAEQVLTEQFPYPESTEILYEETIEKGEIILYKDESGFRHAFVTQGESQNWTNSGNAELNPIDGFSWTMINDVKTPIFTLAGVITNDEITDVIVKQKTEEKTANILYTKDGLKVWYAYFDILEEPNPGEPDPLKIEALSNEGEILWKDGVYN